MNFIPVKIEKVLELSGVYDPVFDCSHSIYAHVSEPIWEATKEIQYTLLAIYPRHGIMELGDINPETKIFEYLDILRLYDAFYSRAKNNVINKISVLPKQICKLKTLDEILKIEGISIKRELIPI